MVPTSGISWKWLWTSSTKGGGICLNCSLKGVSSVTLITYLVMWVQPISVGSNKKTLWYSAKSHSGAESANSRGHDSNPHRSSSSNSFPCLCLTVNLGVWGPWRLIHPLWQPGLHRQFWHCSCSHCSGHWGFLLESLGVGSTIPHHHDCSLATFP